MLFPYTDIILIEILITNLLTMSIKITNTITIIKYKHGNES